MFFSAKRGEIDEKNSDWFWQNLGKTSVSYVFLFYPLSPKLLLFYMQTQNEEWNICVGKKKKNKDAIQKKYWTTFLVDLIRTATLTQHTGYQTVTRCGNWHWVHQNEINAHSLSLLRALVSFSRRSNIIGFFFLLLFSFFCASVVILRNGFPVINRILLPPLFVTWSLKVFTDIARPF